MAECEDTSDAGCRQNSAFRHIATPKPRTIFVAPQTTTDPDHVIASGISASLSAIHTISSPDALTMGGAHVKGGASLVGHVTSLEST